MMKLTIPKTIREIPYEQSPYYLAEYGEREKRTRKDLSDVCYYLKGLVIPDLPAGFTVAEPFRNGLSDDEIKAGISAFRLFLYALYDKLVANKDVIDVKKGEKFDPEINSIWHCFPMISDIASVLFTFGVHGRLESEPRYKLVLHGDDLLKMGKKMSAKRKLEVISFLSELGFHFEDVDFFSKVDKLSQLSKIETFFVQNENDDDIMLGMKLLAQATLNIKAGHNDFVTLFMRGDFYPLAESAPKSHQMNISEFVHSQPMEIKDSIIKLDKLLIENGCKVKSSMDCYSCNGTFTYTSRKNKGIVYKIEIKISGVRVKSVLYNSESTENMCFLLEDALERELLRKQIEMAFKT